MDSTEAETPLKVPTAEELATLRTKYPKLLQIRYEEGVVVFRKVTGPEYQRFRIQGAEDAAKNYQAIVDVVTQCAVWPDKAGVDAILAEWPALIDTFGNGLLPWSGLERNPSKKVL